MSLNWFSTSSGLWDSTHTNLSGVELRITWGLARWTGFPKLESAGLGRFTPYRPRHVPMLSESCTDACLGNCWENCYFPVGVYSVPEHTALKL